MDPSSSLGDGEVPFPFLTSLLRGEPEGSPRPPGAPSVADIPRPAPRPEDRLGWATQDARDPCPRSTRRYVAHEVAAGVEKQRSQNGT